MRWIGILPVVAACGRLGFDDQLRPGDDSTTPDADEGPSWISPDGCRLYMWSDRAGTSDLYVASRGG